MNLLYMAIAWAVGIWFTYTVPGSGSAWPLPLIAGLLLAIALRRDVTIRRAGLCLIAAGLGMWRLESALPRFTDADLARYNDQGSAEMIGVVVDDPEIRDQTIRLRVEIESIRPNDRPAKEVRGMALVYVPRAERYAYGDRLRLYGQPQTPPAFDTFDWGEYLARSGIYTVVFRPNVRILARDQGSPLIAALFRAKAAAHDVIGRMLPEPNSSLLQGVLLGDDSRIAPEIVEDFRATNTSHLLAISGANIAVVVAILMSVFERLLRRKWIAALLTISGIAAYTLFVGASAGVVRAAIMGTFAIVGPRLGRRVDGLTALAASAWGLTIVNPLTLFDLGLILSALATFGLIAYLPWATRAAEAALARLFGKPGIKQVAAIVSDVLLVSVIAQIVTLPVTLLISGQVAPLALPVNMLVAPAQPLIMALGIPAVIGGLIVFPAGQVMGWLAGIPVSYTLAVIRAAAALDPGMTIEISPEAVIGYYAVLFALTAVLSQHPRRRERLIERLRALPVALAGGGVAALLWIAVATRADGRVHLWFMAVGEGSGTLIQTPNGAHILIDGGENPSRLLAAIGDHLPYYKRRIDLLIITEPKPLAVSALDQVVGRYEVRAAITNGQPLPKALQRALETAGTEVVIASAGYSIQTDEGMRIEVLNPAEPPTPDNGADDAPLIVRVWYGDARILITSDISEKGMRSVMASGADWGATVALLPSNGAESSNPAEWLSAIAPQVAVITAQAGERAAQPSQSVLDRLGSVPIYRTDEHGTIEMVTDGRQLWISTGR